MVFKKKDHLVGLDIGSALIKVAEVKETGKGYVLKKVGMTPVSPGAIVEGSIANADEVADAIRKLFKFHKIKEKNVAISTGGYSVVIKTITVPTASEKELHESIRFEAEQYIPYDLDDVNIDYQILGSSEFSPDQMNVLLVAVKKDLVAEYIDLINLAGLNPCIIDVDTFALQNIYEVVAKDKGDEITMLVDVGSSKTSFNILKGTSSLMMRDNDSGTSQIAEEIMAFSDCTQTEAHQVLSGTKGDLIGENDLDGIYANIVQSWCAEIFSIINAYQSKSSEGRVKRIILSGGGSYIKGFPEKLAQEISMEVTLIDPFHGINIDNKLFTTSFLNEIAPLAPIALGLALRKVDDK